MTKSILSGFLFLMVCSPALALKKPVNGIEISEKSASQMGLTATKRTFFGQTHFTLETSAELKEKLHQITVTMYSASEWVSDIDSSIPDLKNAHRYLYNQNVIKRIEVFIIYRTGEMYRVAYDASSP
tara:strand:- start:14611 stop:14991 length:381 start_codon:yes stop_codon:yes gene_type:complete